MVALIWVGANSYEAPTIWSSIGLSVMQNEIFMKDFLSFSRKMRYPTEILHSNLCVLSYLEFQNKISKSIFRSAYLPGGLIDSRSKYRTSQIWNNNSLLVNFSIFQVRLCMQRLKLCNLGGFWKWNFWLVWLTQFLRSLSKIRTTMYAA